MREYPELEDDVRTVVKHVETLHRVLREGPCELREPLDRLLGACGPEECGLRLHFQPPSGPNMHGWFVAGNGDLVCRLPKDHHPFSPYSGAPKVCHQPIGSGITVMICGKYADDPIHAPGHMPDVPDECWR